MSLGKISQHSLMKNLLEDNLSAGVIPWVARATLESSEYSLCCLSSVEAVILEMYFGKSYPKPLFMRVAHIFIFEVLKSL